MLTGTPLQNDLEELQNLLQFLLPDVFDRGGFSHSDDLQVRPTRVHPYSTSSATLVLMCCILYFMSEKLSVHLHTFC